MWTEHPAVGRRPKTMSLYVISVYLHIMAAVVWLGGMLFLALVLVPVVRRLEPPGVGAQAMRAVGRRFLPVAWASLAVLLVTGLVNLDYRGVSPWEAVSGALLDTEFGVVLAIKLGVFLAILLLSAVHDFVAGPRALRRMQAVGLEQGAGRPAPSTEMARLRKKLSYLARFNAVLALVAVALAVVLVRGLP